MNHMAYAEEKRVLHAKCARESYEQGRFERCLGERNCPKCGQLYKKYFGKKYRKQGVNE